MWGEPQQARYGGKAVVEDARVEAKEQVRDVVDKMLANMNKGPSDASLRKRPQLRRPRNPSRAPANTQVCLTPWTE